MQVNDQLFADQVSCLRCMIWGKQRVSVVKVMILSAQSREDYENGGACQVGFSSSYCRTM